MASTSRRGARIRNAKMFRKDPPPAPAHLSQKAKELWCRLHYEFDLTDTAALVLLEGALTSYDRAAEARAIIKKQGPVVFDRFQQAHTNPACGVERDALGTMSRLLRALNLDLEPLASRSGRQPGDRGSRLANYTTSLGAQSKTQ